MEPHDNGFLGPAVALNGPGTTHQHKYAVGGRLIVGLCGGLTRLNKADDDAVIWLKGTVASTLAK